MFCPVPGILRDMQGTRMRGASRCIDIGTAKHDDSRGRGEGGILEHQTGYDRTAFHQWTIKRICGMGLSESVGTYGDADGDTPRVFPEMAVTDDGWREPIEHEGWVACRVYCEVNARVMATASRLR